MKKRLRSEKKTFLAGALIIMGRISLSVSFCLILSALALSYPIQSADLAIGISIIVLLLLVAGHLLGDYLWIINVFIQSIAFAFLVLGAVIIRLYIDRNPHSISSYEISVVTACIAGFVLSVYWLRRKKHARKSARHRIG
jgi:hypothetical protein